MKNILNNIIFFLSVVFLPISAFADESEILKGGKIEGQVIEASTQMPVEFANVVVFNSVDSSMVVGGITGETGEFDLADIPNGSYYLRIQFMGYETQIVENIDVTEKKRKFHLGTIPMGLLAIELEAAQITAERMAVEYKLDRKVINVGQDLDAAGSSAVEVLEKVPSIRVDINGDVFLRGSSNFTVLIDGKPSVLTGSEALQQLPANTIENIEILTNPSAKYDPDGTAGIINIKLKRNKLQGFSGMVNATVGTGEKYASDVYLNYKTGDFNIYGGIEWNDRRFPSSGNESRESLINDTLYYRYAETEMAWLRNGLTFKGGMDYSIDKNQTVSIGGEYGDGGFGMDNYKQIHEFSDPVTVDDYYISDNTFRWSRNFYSLNANYKREFEQEGHELNFFGFYSERDGSQKQDQQEITTDGNWNPIDPYPLLTRSIEEGPSRQFRIEVDYTKPVFANGKLETGYQFRRNSEEEDYFLENYDYDKSEWIENELYTKYSLFERNIHAAYAVFGNKFKGFDYQLGLRGEYTYRDISVTNTGQSSVVDRFDYFPSVHIAKKVLDNNQFMGSYSRRVDRPRSYFLEPFETYIDENTRRVGNPDLLPEYTDSYEIGYLRTLSAGSLSLETYYRKTDNKITRIQTLDEETGILYSQFENLNNDQALGMEGAFIYDITKWFNLNWSATLYNYRLDDLSSEEVQERTSNNWDTRLITSFKLKTNTRFQLNLAYNSATVTAQGRAEESYYADFTIKQDFLKKQLSATLKVADIFATRLREYTTRGTNFSTYEYRKPESRVVSLTLSYRINNFKEQKSQRSVDMGGGM